MSLSVSDFLRASKLLRIMKTKFFWKTKKESQCHEGVEVGAGGPMVEEQNSGGSG